MKTHNLKQLQDKWYKKLKDKGFEDIEDRDINGNFKCWLKTGYKTYNYSNPEHFQLKDNMEDTNLRFCAIRDYYRMAEQFGNEFRWKGLEVHKTVWIKHAEGQAYRGIAKDLELSLSFVQRSVNKTRKYLMKYIKERLNEDSD